MYLGSARVRSWKGAPWGRAQDADLGGRTPKMQATQSRTMRETERRSAWRGSGGRTHRGQDSAVETPVNGEATGQESRLEVIKHLNQPTGRPAHRSKHRKGERATRLQGALENLNTVLKNLKTGEKVQILTVLCTVNKCAVTQEHQIPAVCGVNAVSPPGTGRPALINTVAKTRKGITIPPILQLG